MWSLWLESFNKHNVLKILSCCSMYQYSIPFYGEGILHCINILHFVYPFFSWWAFELIPRFAYYENTAIDICLQVFMQTYVFILLAVYLGMANRVLIHFDLIFYIVWGSNFILLHVTMSSCPEPLVGKTISFPTEWSWLPCQNQFSIKTWKHKSYWSHEKE